MRIFDKNGIEIESPDLEKGYLVNDRLFIMHHEAVSAVEEVGHFEVVAEYDNGGKDVEWVVEIPKVEAKEAWDEYEEILRFVPFTEKELAEKRIAELKQNLFATDYNILKIVEGAAALSEMAAIIAQRAQWRKEINELERKL